MHYQTLRSVSDHQETESLMSEHYEALLDGLPTNACADHRLRAFYA
jgi:hypothetical protein